MMNADLYLMDVFATNLLNLGSDYRVVYVEISIPCVKLEHEGPHVCQLPRGWR